MLPLFRKLLVVMSLALSCGVASASLLFGHQFGETFTQQVCTSCLPQLNRAWDAFDLTHASRITAIEALLGFEQTYPASGTTPINISIWNADLSVQLFAQDFLPAQLSITISPAGFPVHAVLATFAGIDLPAGTYFLSLFNGSQVEALGWSVSPETVHGRAVQSLGSEPTPASTRGLGADLAFRVFGNVRSVPEPGPLALVALGALLALSLNHRRRTGNA